MHSFLYLLVTEGTLILVKNNEVPNFVFETHVTDTQSIDPESPAKVDTQSYSCSSSIFEDFAQLTLVKWSGFSGHTKKVHFRSLQSLLRCMLTS